MIIDFDILCEKLLTTDGKWNVIENAVLYGLTSKEEHQDKHRGRIDDRYDYPSLKTFAEANESKQGDVEKIIASYLKRNDIEMLDQIYSAHEFRLRAAGLLRTINQPKKALKVYQRLTPLRNNKSALSFVKNISNHAVIGAAEIFAEQGDYSQALQLFEEIGLNESHINFVERRGSPELCEQKRKKYYDNLSQWFEKQYPQERKDVIINKIKTFYDGCGGFKPGSFEICRKLFNDYEAEEKVFAALDDKDQIKTIKLEKLLQIYQEKPEYQQRHYIYYSVLVAELLGNFDLAITLYQTTKNFYDAIRLVKKQGNDTLADELYKTAAETFEPTCNYERYCELSRISELMDEPDRADNYRLLACLVGEFSNR